MFDFQFYTSSILYSVGRECHLTSLENIVSHHIFLSRTILIFVYQNVISLIDARPNSKLKIKEYHHMIDATPKLKTENQRTLYRISIKANNNSHGK
jgi:hypothetical protein